MEGVHNVNFSIQNMHDITSHKDEKCKYMTLAQRSAVKDAIRASPHLTPIAVRRNLKNLSPTKHVAASKLQSVRYAVRQERKKLVAVQFPDLGVSITDTHGSLSELCDAILLTNFIRKHNDSTDDFHLGMHTPVCVSYHLEGGECIEIDMSIHLFELLTSDFLQMTQRCTWHSPTRIRCWTWLGA